MLLHLLVLNVMFIPLLNGVNVSVTSEQSSATSSKATVKPKSKLSLPTEGGKVDTEVPPVLSLSNEKSTVLLTLDKEFGNTNEKKPVKPRKGALLESAKEDNSTIIVSPHEKLVNDTEITQLLPVDKAQKNTVPSTTGPKEVKSTTSAALNATSSNLDSLNKTTVVTEHVKKPRILVYDDLASDKVNESPSLPVLKSSSKPVLDQIPSPNSKLHLKTKGAEPGMVMPIVITIVVVPAFVVLAYMAVKRGREAWKNRHYKRMDFLLDGMYND